MVLLLFSISFSTPLSLWFSAVTVGKKGQQKNEIDLVQVSFSYSSQIARFDWAVDMEKDE